MLFVQATRLCSHCNLLFCFLEMSVTGLCNKACSRVTLQLPPRTSSSPAPDTTSPELGAFLMRASIFTLAGCLMLRRLSSACGAAGLPTTQNPSNGIPASPWSAVSEVPTFAQPACAETSWHVSPAEPGQKEACACPHSMIHIA